MDQTDDPTGPFETRSPNNTDPRGEPEKEVIPNLDEEQIARRDYVKALLYKPNNKPPPKKLRPKVKKTPTDEETMDEMATCLGIKNVNANMIRQWVYTKSKDEALKDVDIKVFYDEEYDEPRRDTAIFILHNLLYMHPKDIRITEAKMSLNHMSGILWIHGDKNFIRNVFIQAAKVADDSVQLMPFTPAVARPRKKKIESILTKLRAKAELDTVKTQV